MPGAVRAARIWVVLLGPGWCQQPVMNLELLCGPMNLGLLCGPMNLGLLCGPMNLGLLCGPGTMRGHGLAYLCLLLQGSGRG